MEKLIKFIEHRFKLCQNSSGYEAKKIFLQQAFGAIKFYAGEHPEREDELCTLWEEWREKFISEIYD